MACLNMQINNEQQAAAGGFLGPRISFSNDFGDTQQATSASNLKLNTSYREAPVSSEFEFSVPCFASNSADELVFKAKINVPLKEKVVTLRDELLASDDDDDYDIFLPKSSGWWRFGRTQTQTQNQCQNPSFAKKGDNKNHGGLDTIDEGNQYLRK
nr:ARP protein [Tanacetum cinerariifolium]